VRVGDQVYGNGIGHSKKEAEQAAAETAYGEIAVTHGEDPAPDAIVDAAEGAAHDSLDTH
jgi:ribonuclease-3